MTMLRLIFRLCLLWRVVEAIFHLPLGHDSIIHWDVNYDTRELIVEIHTKNFDSNGGWVGVGFSNYGHFTDGSGDFCVVWKSLLTNHKTEGNDIGEHGFQMTDVHVYNETMTLYSDKQQDCLDFKYIFKNETLKWTFRRNFVTCDAKDYALEEGTTHLHWVKGNGPLFDIKGVSLKKAAEIGFVRVRLLKNLIPDPILDPKETTTFDVITSKVKVPASETTYWCAIIKLPDRIRNKKHHVVQFAVNVQQGNEELVHHMEVFHCVASPSLEIPMYAGVCDDSPQEISSCTQVMAAWAMGAEPLHYPIEAGLPIGGPDFNPYLRLEIHYNNPLKKADWVDSSGMKFWVTEKFRSHDAGVIELGLEYTDKNSIPPKQNAFAVTGICNTECTSVGLPAEGITVFASQLHTHLSGIRVITRHFRRREAIFYRQQALHKNFSHISQEDLNGYIELPTFNWDNHYSTHFQEIRLLKKPIKVLPGDVLVTSCVYKTTDRSKMTVGGFAISDEMCVNYIHYYPRSNLEVCKSSVSWKSLRDYFKFEATMDGQKGVIADGPVSDNYNNIEWTPFRVNLLSDFYNESPIDMQCNQSDGTRFSGEWDDMPVPNFPDLQPARNPNLDPDCVIGSAQDNGGERDLLRGREEKLQELLTVARRGVLPA